MPDIAAAGYRVVALDLRGFGASDKPPSGHDLPTACDDLAAVVRSLGAGRAAIVGQGLGAWLAWSMPSHHPSVTAGVAPIGMPHPRILHRVMWRHPLQRRAGRYPRGGQAPFASAPQAVTVARHLREWSGPDDTWITPEVTRRYTEAMSFPFVRQATSEYHQWFHRCRFTPTGVRYLHRLRDRIETPVLQLSGEHDPLSRPTMAGESSRYVAGDARLVSVPGVGHFAPEEAPDVVTSELIDWLALAHPA